MTNKSMNYIKSLVLKSKLVKYAIIKLLIAISIAILVLALLLHLKLTNSRISIIVVVYIFAIIPAFIGYILYISERVDKITKYFYDSILCNDITNKDKAFKILVNFFINLDNPILLNLEDSAINKGNNESLKMLLLLIMLSEINGFDKCKTFKL